MMRTFMDGSSFCYGYGRSFLACRVRLYKLRQSPRDDLRDDEGRNAMGIEERF